MTVTSTIPAGPRAPMHPRLRRVRYEPEPGQARPAPVPPPDPPPDPNLPDPNLPDRSPPDRSPPDRGGPASAAREFVEAHHAITRILRLALEVLDGRRPAAQLAPHFAAAPLRYWRAATGQRAVRTPARRGRLRLCLPCPGVAEMAVTCYLDGRIRAMAARFERQDGRWRCMAVRLG